MCGLRGALVSVVAFRAWGHGFKSTYGCPHILQKPSISPRLFGQCTLNIYVPFTIYYWLLYPCFHQNSIHTGWAIGLCDFLVRTSPFHLYVYARRSDASLCTWDLPCLGRLGPSHCRKWAFSIFLNLFVYCHWTQFLTFEPHYRWCFLVKNGSNFTC